MLTQLYEDVSRTIVAFISKMLPLPAGQQPVFPEIFGTGFLINDSGLVATNRHVVEFFDQVGRHPQTGEFAGAALIFLVEADKHGCQMLNLGVKSWGAINSFTSSTEWYGQPVPDIGFVQLEVRETPFLELADEEFYLRPGMEIATIGYPLGTVPLTLHGKISQVGPFIRRGIVSSVYPFTTPRPHGFTIDIMQQGGSSGSPIFAADSPKVVGMMWGGVNEPRFAQSESASLMYTLNTNISLAEPAHIIRAALETVLAAQRPDTAGFSTLQQLREAHPRPTENTRLSWSSTPLDQISRLNVQGSSKA
ncbi:MAG: serine protease [Terracidiphilus sp.]|nr:serine protease [Terracidiphilus sp.]